MDRIPWRKDSFIPAAEVYAFSQEAASAWAWAIDRDGQMKLNLSCCSCASSLSCTIVQNHSQSFPAWQTFGNKSIISLVG